MKLVFMALALIGGATLWMAVFADVGMALIVKHRMDVDAAMRAAELQQLPVAAEGAAEERAIDKIAVAAEALHVVDKVA